MSKPELPEPTPVDESMHEVEAAVRGVAIKIRLRLWWTKDGNLAFVRRVRVHRMDGVPIRTIDTGKFIDDVEHVEVVHSSRG